MKHNKKLGDGQQKEIKEGRKKKIKHKLELKNWNARNQSKRPK